MWIVVIDGPDILSSNLYYAAQKHNIKIASLSKKKENSTYADKTIYTETFEHIVCLKAIMSTKLDELVSIFPIYESHVGLANSLIKALDEKKAIKTLSSTPPNSKVKTYFRNLSNLNDFYPCWKRISLNLFEKEVQTVLGEFNSIVIKPIHGFQGIGVQHITKETNLADAKKELIQSIYHLNNKVMGVQEFDADEVTNYCIIEEYIDSTDYVVDAVIARGQVFFYEFCEKAKRSEFYNEDRAYFTEHDLSNEVMLSAKNFLSQLSIKHGNLVSIIHAEFRIKDNKAIFFDVALRAGGFGLSDQIHYYSTNISLFSIWLGALLGTVSSPVKSETMKPVVLYLGQVKDGGIVSELPVANNIFNNKDVSVRLEKQFCAIGDTLQPMPNYTGHTSATLLEILDNSNPRQKTFELIESCEDLLNSRYEMKG